MFQLALSASSLDRARRKAAPSEASVGRRRNRMTPGVDSLETRDCPSGAASHLGLADTAHALVATKHAPAQTSHDAVRTQKAGQKGPQTIYVSPNGKTGAAAGKNATHSASLTVALKRAKAGTTIVLAPGVYTQVMGITGKSNITIEGAAGNSSILAASGNYAAKVYSSSNITIENVSFRSPNGSGLAVVGSSVNLVNVQADGSHGDGVVVTGGGGVNASNSHFDSSQTGDGMDVQGGSATISGCTFNGNGTAGGSVPGGSGISIEGNSQATIMNSQFVGNLNANLVAFGQAQVTAQGSTFSQSQQGDGALFANSGAVNLTGNTFAMNSTVGSFMPGVGFDGIEFFHTFTGSAVVEGNKFSNNTADGIYIGGSSSPIQVLSNTFFNSVVGTNILGVDLDSTVASLSAVIQGNTFTVSPGSSDQGIFADGSGATATIGGTGTQENTFQNYSSNKAIVQANAPHLTILGNIGV
jgi:parallel beta-helix repeat protein